MVAVDMDSNGYGCFGVGGGGGGGGTLWRPWRVTCDVCQVSKGFFNSQWCLNIELVSALNILKRVGCKRYIRLQNILGATWKINLELVWANSAPGSLLVCQWCSYLDWLKPYCPTDTTVNPEYFVRTKLSCAGDHQPFVHMEFPYRRWPLRVHWLGLTI